ncbi:MAG: PAS domain S-box protein [Candidatus Eisenbacteria bacterium]|nr:PAS domain S-box protein [Candidatus Eisenbacteria bacterium]
MSLEAGRRPRTRPGLVAWVASAAAILLGAGDLLGWQLDLRGLTSVVPGLVAMNPATAVCFILAGVALGLLRDGADRRHLRFLGLGCAALVALAGLVKLGDLHLGWQVGFDQWLFREKLGSASGLLPNRMAPNTALDFLFLGAALLTLRLEPRRGAPPSQLLALVPLLLSFLALLGYAYDVRPFYDVTKQMPAVFNTAMALNTALAFLLLSTAVLFDRPDVGLPAVFGGEDAGGLLARRVLPLAVLVLAGLGWLELRGQAIPLYDSRLGVSLLVASGIIVLAVIIWLAARSLRGADQARRQATEALRQAHEELEARVEARTAELAREVEERRRAEASLLKLTRAVEQTADAVVITDRNGRIEYVNPAFETLTGYARDEAVGQTSAILKSGAQPPAFYQELWQTILGGGVFQALFVNRKKSGERYHEEKTITPIRDETGAIMNFVSTGKDISGRVKLEEQLRQAQKMEAIGRLAGGVAHDFNNLLTTMLGYSQLSRSGLQPDQPIARNLEEIEQAVHRAAALTRQLLAFSRQQVLQPKILDLNRLVLDLDKMLRRLIGEDIELRTCPASGLGRIKADESQIEQIVLNLAVNARDAMPEGGNLTIETGNVQLDEHEVRDRPGLVPGPYVLLAVSDTGCGMDAATRARIFEPFFTTKEVGKGTGLGLSTVDGIVRQSGGHIEVRSEPGHGSSFRIHLPRADDALVEAPRPAAAEGAFRGTETVLVVEDEEQVRAVVRETLESGGYTVLEATSGWEGLALCERRDRPFDLVISDVVMPGLSGPDFGACIAGLQPEARLLYISGYAERASSRHGVPGPETPFLQKPFTPDTLLGKVREVLDGPRREAA